MPRTTYHRPISELCQQAYSLIAEYDQKGYFTDEKRLLDVLNAFEKRGREPLSRHTRKPLNHKALRAVLYSFSGANERRLAAYAGKGLFSRGGRTLILQAS